VRLTSRPGLEVQPALSPDGKTLYFSARHAERDDLDIWFTPAGGKRPIDLTADCSEDDGYPAVSPDGRQIAFRSERDDGGIFRMGTTGQSVRRLTGGCFDPAWSPDGSRIACTTCPGRDPFNRTCRGELRVVDVASGTERTIELEDAAAPSWSADGRRLAFWGLSASGAQRDLWTVALDGAAPVALTDDPAVDWNPIWSADGASLAFLSDRSGAPGLWKLAVDVASGPVLGEPRSLVLPTEFADGVRISGGRLVYASRALRASVARHVFDPERLEIVGTPRTVVEVTGRMQSASVPPEGRTVAFTSYFPQQDLYVVGNDGGAPVQLTDDRAFDRFPIWDPNGERIHFMSNRGGPYETWAIRPDGSGLEQLTRTGDDSGWIPLLSPDRAQLVTSTFRGPRVFDARGPAPWTTFDRLADGEIGIHPRLDVEGIGVAWLPDGRRLLVNNGEGGMRTLDIATGAVRPVAGGERFAESRGAFSADLPTIVDFRNVQEADIWLAEGIE
jgi:Tol biopolymer transport system component